MEESTMAMEKDLLLTCDAGTTGCKCTVFDARGEAVCSVRRSYPTSYPRPNWSEQDPQLIVEAVFGCIRELLQQVSPQRIACVGLDGTMNGCIPVDEAGTVLHPNIIHSDTRTEKQVNEIAGVISQKDFYRLTGNRIDTHYTLPKILWIKENLPEVYRKTRWWLNTKDYLYGRLTGRFGYTDYSDASLTIALDINNRRWATELLQVSGGRCPAHAPPAGRSRHKGPHHPGRLPRHGPDYRHAGGHRRRRRCVHRPGRGGLSPPAAAIPTSAPLPGFPRLLPRLCSMKRRVSSIIWTWTACPIMCAARCSAARRPSTGR